LYSVDIFECIWYDKGMQESKYSDPLRDLLSRPFFSLKDARDLGIPKRVIFYWEKKGVLEKVFPGVYRAHAYEPQVDFEWEDLAQTAASIKNGVICLISALCYYDLTDEIMRENWIAIPNKSRAIKRPNTHIFRMRNMTLGREKMELGEYKTYIFDRERTIVDSFRYLSLETSLKALKRYLNDTNHRPELDKIEEYAKILRVNIAPYILSFMT
jgi:predicted transcriptional regulator of viral defense system